MFSTKDVTELFKNAQIECTRIEAACERELKALRDEERDRKLTAGYADPLADGGVAAKPVAVQEATETEVTKFRVAITGIVDALDARVAALESLPSLDDYQAAEEDPFCLISGLEGAYSTMADKIPLAVSGAFQMGCATTISHAASTAVRVDMKRWASTPADETSSNGDGQLDEVLESLHASLPEDVFRQFSKSMWATVRSLSSVAAPGSRGAQPFLGSPSLLRFALAGRAAPELEAALESITTAATEQLTSILTTPAVDGRDEVSLLGFGANGGRSLGFVVDAVWNWQPDEDDNAVSLRQRAALVRRLTRFLRSEYSTALERALRDSIPRQVLGALLRNAAEVTHQVVYAPMRESLAPFLELDETPLGADGAALSATLRTILYRVLFHIQQVYGEQRAGRRREKHHKGKLTTGAVEEMAGNAGLLVQEAGGSTPEGHRLMELSSGETNGTVVFFYIDQQGLKWKRRGEREFRTAKSVREMIEAASS